MSVTRIDVTALREDREHVARVHQAGGPWSGPPSSTSAMRRIFERLSVYRRCMTWSRWACALAATTALALMPVGVSARADAASDGGASIATSGISALAVYTALARRTTSTPVWTHTIVSAGGVRQWIECAGSGRVTVIVIPGLHATHTMWGKVLPAFAQTTRTCIIDRPGLGASPPRQPHRAVDAGRHADEMWALLTKMGITTRIVVVAHSYGGLIARAFIARHRSAVVGLMLVEGVAPFDRLSRYWTEGGDRVDTLVSSRAAVAMQLGSMPLVVEAAQDPDRSYWGSTPYGASESDIADWRAHQLAASHVSTDSAYVIVRRSAHVIEQDRPDAVIAGLRLLVTAARLQHWMLRCTLAAYGVMPRCG